MRLFALLALALGFGFCGDAEAAQVQGRVRLSGPAPRPERVKIEPKRGAHSTEGCGSLEKPSQKLIVDPSGGIQNAVVWLEGAAEAGQVPGEGPVLDQRECIFVPHVVALRVGQELAIRNSEPVLHNVRIFPDGKPDMLMHRWQRPDASDIRWPFPESGRYVVRCGVHPWMYAWVVVLPHRMSAVTDGAGHFSLRGIPAGRHALRVWHETLGERRVTIQVREPEVQIEPIQLEPAGG